MQIVKKEKMVNMEMILKEISVYDIYRYYFGEFVVNRKYLNHLRGDKSQPSFMITNRYQDLVHVDFADSYWRGNAFNLVQQINRCDFNTAIRTIDADFKLGLYDRNIIRDASIVTWSQPKIIEAKKPSVIQVISGKFTKLQLDYWNGYELSYDDIKDDVYPIKSYYINKEKYPVEDLTFGYLFDGKYWKIYKPFNKKDKWKTNAPITQMYHLDKIDKCENCIIVKSVKDYLVSKKFLTTCTAGVQNESTVAISDDNIEYIKANSTNRYICFDNEDVGVENCKFYNEKGFGYWNVPRKYYLKYGIKDPSDFVYRYGGDRLRKEVIKKIKL